MRFPRPARQARRREPGYPRLLQLRSHSSSSSLAIAFFWKNPPSGIDSLIESGIDSLTDTHRAWETFQHSRTETRNTYSDVYFTRGAHRPRAADHWVCKGAHSSRKPPR